MKQYIARCPESELPKQERLVLCFLEGLLDEDLYMLLFAQDHKDFEFCCFEAQRLDDNRKGKGRSFVDEQRLDSSSQVRQNEEVVSHTIAEKVARLLKQENRATQQYRPYQPTQPLRDNPQGALKWCEPCRRWGNHSTNECYSRQRYMREVGAVIPGDFKPMNTQPVSSTNEVARPVLGAQPSPPGTTPFHYVHEVEDSGQSLELVPSGPYYEENQESMQLAISQLTDLDTSIVQLPAQALYMLANGGYRPQGGYAKRSTSPRADTPVGPCFECGGPHLVRDCLVRKEKNLATNAGGYQPWPRVLWYCGGCGNDHLAKDCPNKPAETKTSFGYVEVIPSPSVSETEGDVVSLRMITRDKTQKDQLQPLLTPIEGEISQQGNSQKGSKQKRQKNCKNKSKNKNLKNGSSSGNDSSDSGSWESIVLETPDGTRRLYVVQTTADKKQSEPNPTLETAQHTKTTEPLRVVTRAQAKKARENEEDTEEIATENNPLTRTRRKGNEPQKETQRTSPNKSEELQPREKKDEKVELSSTSRDTDSGGSVLVDKVNETLESILKAYEKRLTTDTTIPPKLKEYPNPIQEKVNLVRNHALIRDTQTMWEGPLPYSTDRRSMHVPNLEAIQEISENEKEMEIGENQEEKKSDPQSDVIPSLQEDNVHELWEEVRKLKDQDEGSLVSAPFSVIHLTHSIESEHVQTPQDTVMEENDDCSQANTLATLPSYVGKTEIGSEILPIPLSSHITPSAKDTLNLHAIMSAPVTATLPLMDFLRVKPELWEQVSKLLRNKGYSISKHFNPMKQADSDPEPFLEKISLNKLNDHGRFKSENGHTTLPVRVLNVKTFAVLDSGAGISIATKEIWQKWGALALKKTRMELQLADGNLEHPLGLLVDMPVESCGVTYEHTFAVVDFGRDTNYDVILGRPFMRQMEVIQDWGSDYLYLRHDGVTTRVSLFDHTYRDVVRNPIDDFDSFSSGLSPLEADSSGYLENAWLFQEPTEKALAEN